MPYIIKIVGDIIMIIVLIIGLIGLINLQKQIDKGYDDFHKKCEQWKKEIEETKMFVEEHTGFDEVEGDYIHLTPDKNSKFELRRLN